MSDKIQSYCFENLFLIILTDKFSYKIIIWKFGQPSLIKFKFNIQKCEKSGLIFYWKFELPSLYNSMLFIRKFKQSSQIRSKIIHPKLEPEKKSKLIIWRLKQASMTQNIHSKNLQPTLIKCKIIHSKVTSPSLSELKISHSKNLSSSNYWFEN